LAADGVARRWNEEWPSFFLLTMGGPAGSREARPEDKLHDPPIQGNRRWRLRPWMAGSEAGHGEKDNPFQAKWF
jgi:hypothetical protein